MAKNIQTSPLVSVVTATFNALEGVKATVASVAEQSFRSVEHIVIDGGSADGTVEYLRSLGEAVRWISEPDRGIADALNKGVAMARGEYILVLQAEDTFLDADSLTDATSHLRGETEIVSFGIVLGRERRISRGFGPRTRLHPPFYHQGAFCRASLFERIGPFDTGLSIAMDYEFFVRAYLAKASSVILPEPISHMPQTGISSQLDWPTLKRRLAENRRIHFRHARQPTAKLFYRLYWLAYPPFKRLRGTLDRMRRAGRKG
jgi:glycosyltransferase involved in cell wall biosynthesis